MTAVAPDALAGRLAGTPLVLMLDVDGTLAPIAPRPGDAEVPAETRALLAALAARADVRLALVSGRGAADALRLVGVAGVWAVGNHGFELITPDGQVTPHPAAARYQSPLRAAAAELTAELAAVDGAFVEDKGLTLSVHYRQAAPADGPRVRDIALAAGARHGLRTGDGKMIVELRPPVAVDKGTAVLALSDALGGGAGGSFFFAGDDVTDEDAFIRLRAERPGAVTVHVGTRPDTAAEFRLAGPEALRALLATLLAERQRQGP